MTKHIVFLTLFFYVSLHGAGPLDLSSDIWSIIISKPSHTSNRIRSVLTLRMSSKKLSTQLPQGDQLKYSIGLDTDALLEEKIVCLTQSTFNTIHLLLSLHSQPERFIFEQYKLNNELGIKMALTQKGAILLWAINSAGWYTQRWVDFEKKLPYNEVGIARAEDGVKKIIFAEDLIIAGDQINFADKKSGATPLHRALWNERDEIVRLLIKQGANLNAATRCSACTDSSSCNHYTITPLQRMLYQLIPGNFKLHAGYHSYTSGQYDPYKEGKTKDIYESLTPRQKILMIYDAYGFEIAQRANQHLPATEQLSAWQCSRIKNLSQKEIDDQIKNAESEDSGTPLDSCTLL